MNDRFEFTLNGKTVVVAGEPANRPLLDYLRATGLTGSKQGCAEGDCGACTVVIVDVDASGKRALRAVNSCITLLPMVAGREVITVEGVAGEGGALHPVQRAMVERYGSQCGYCTPGFTTSMVEAFYRDEVSTPAQIADQLAGNLCRCTGYRPIREAMGDAIACRADRAGDALHQILARPEPQREALAYEAGGETFLRPTSLDELLRLRAEHPEAELCAGATEIGVDINKKGKRFPFLIATDGVAELRAVTAGAGGWRIGGAATLTAVEEALGGEHPAIDKMLRVFASRQIRNRATLAGNLVTASPIGDMAPVLLALDARVELCSTRGARQVPIDAFFTGYRKTALRPGEILSAVLVPRAAGPEGVTRISRSYKVSKRRELDISIVAAAFTVDLDAEGVVRRARLAYGGVAPTPARARAVEALLEGRPWARGTVEGVLPALAGAFTPIKDARGSAEYRRGLIVSLFEKFFDGAESLAQDLPLEYATVSSHAAPPKPGAALHHESGALHTRGTAVYVDDQAQRRSMLEIWPVSSPHAHARILRRDATVARAMPGVVAVLMAEDIPGDNDVGAVRKDEILLADREVMFHGHMVAVVVGESYQACRAAAAAVVVEYEPLPAILGIAQAVEAGSYHNAPHVIRRGDVDQALAGSPHRLDGQLDTGGQEHFYLETHAAWAERGEDWDVFVCSSTQHPSEVQAAVAHVLHLPRHKVVVESPRMGGGFGGKETQGNTWAALAALASWKTGRPVRVQLDRDVDIQLTGKRHPFRADFTCGFDDEGRIHALRARLVSDGGWALDLSESICDRALFHLDNAYDLPALRFTGRVARTNVVSNTAFRGFGGPQGMLVIEEILDRIARRLGLPPEVVRERNFYRGEPGSETSTTPYGQPVVDNRIPAMWRALLSSARLAERRAEIDRFNAGSPRIKRGIAVTPVKFGISFTASFLNQAGALVLVYRDGTVQVSHGGTEMGQGLHTKMRGVAMRELGLPESMVRVMKTVTDKVPNTSATAASSGADLNGAAVQAACTTLRERLAPVAAALLGEGVAPGDVAFRDGACWAGAASVPFSRVVEQAYLSQVSLSATGYYRTPGIAYDRSKGQGSPFYYFAGGVAVSEVEVDGYTGMKRLLRADILHDVGDSLNPGIDRGQIEGAFVQGAGWLTGEELVWDADGRLLTHSASTYQIPSFSDAPAELHVTLLPDAAQRGTIHGSKAVGEPPFMLAISVREALRDAVAAFGAPGGDVPLPVPATHEALFLAIRRRLP